MRVTRCITALAVLTAIAAPTVAAIKAMDLKELMSITSDAIHGRIVSKDTFEMDRPREGSVYTKLVVEGESLRTGQAGTFEIVFHGSHDVRDAYTISEMPTLQDTRVGGEIVAFFDKNEWRHGKNVVFDFSGLYRVEQGFGAPVLIGKGEGAAFVENTKLLDVRTRVASVHAELAAEAAAGK